MDSFPNVEIYAGEPLGAGAYGNVCKAVCGQLPCAAKLLHETMFQYDDPGIDSFAKRFEVLSNTLTLFNTLALLHILSGMPSSFMALLMDIMSMLPKHT